MIYPCNRVRDIIKISLSFVLFTFVLLEKKKKNSYVKGSYVNLMVSNDTTKGKVQVVNFVGE